METGKYTFALVVDKADHLKKTLDSILNQTYTNLRIDVIDCASVNNTAAIKELLETYQDSRICYEEAGASSDLKMSCNWNIALDCCQSEFFVMSSGREIYSPHFLEKMNPLVEKYQDINVFRARTRLTNTSLSLMAEDPELEEFADQFAWNRQHLEGRTVECIGSYVYRASNFWLEGGFVYFPYGWYSDIATAIKIGDMSGGVNTSDFLIECHDTVRKVRSHEEEMEHLRMQLDVALRFDEWVNDVAIAAIMKQHGKEEADKMEKLYYKRSPECIKRFTKSASLSEMLKLSRELGIKKITNPNTLVKEWFRK